MIVTKALLESKSFKFFNQITDTILHSTLSKAVPYPEQPRNHRQFLAVYFSCLIYVGT